MGRISRLLISSNRVVKAYVREDHEDQKFTKAAEKLYRLFVKAEGTLAFNNPVMMLVIYGCIIALSWLGAQYIVIGDMTTGELTSMFSYVMSMMMSLMMLSMVFVMITMSAASGRRIAEVLNETPDLKNPQHPVTEIEDGRIDFNHVSFSYKHGSGEETLHDIDMHIRSGETIGIIGGTGCGKSTLVNLIPRFYEVSQGCIRVDGVDVRDYPMDQLRGKVGIVPQRAVLFSGTLRQNMQWRKQDATDEEIWQALETAQAASFVRKMPDGLDSVILQGGKNLSGGQKQRLTIARALVGEPEILILDDSASALDFATDAALRRAIAKFSAGRGNRMTTIIVSQRANTVRYADQIVVLDDGKAAGIGTHEQLLESCQTYREIYWSQNERQEAVAQKGGER